MAIRIPLIGVLGVIGVVIAMIVDPWLFILGLLVASSGFLIVVLLPMPPQVRTFALKLLSKVCGNRSGRIILVAICIALVAQFGRAAYKQYEHQANISKARDGQSMINSADERWKLYREQRNMYLSIFALFSILVLHRYERLWFDMMDTRAKDQNRILQLQQQLEGKAISSSSLQTKANGTEIVDTHEQIKQEAK